MKTAPLLFVSPTQANFVMPAGLADGAAVIALYAGNNIIREGEINLAPSAPGLFAANADGQGLAAAVALRIRGDGSSVYENVAAFDAALGRFVPVPIDLGHPTERVLLVPFGMGSRGRSALAAVSVKIGGLEAAELYYVGAQPSFTGLDQLNALLPRSLAGRGEVDVVVIVDGKAANTVRVNIK